MAYKRVRQPSLSPLLHKFLSKKGLLLAYKKQWRTSGSLMYFRDSITRSLNNYAAPWDVIEEEYKEWKGKHILYQLRNVKMRVVRIEHPDFGVGIFQCKKFFGDKELNYLKDLSKINDRHYSMPVPFEDSIDNDALDALKNWRCAYFDLAEMNRWVKTKEIEKLASKWGFRVYEIEIKAPLIGNYQVVFGVHNIVKKTDITNQVINISNGK